VGRGAPPKQPGWDYVDMSGRYALPGLFDVHAHITIGPFNVQVKNGTPTVSMQSSESITRFELRRPPEPSKRARRPISYSSKPIPWTASRTFARWTLWSQTELPGAPRTC